MIEVVAFASALTDTGEHRHAAIRLRDIVDQLKHRDGLADAGAAEQADLAALRKGANQVDHLDAGGQELDRRRELIELRRQLMDLAALVGLDRSLLVDRAAQYIHDAAERRRTDRHRNRLPRARHFHSTAQSVRAAERDAADDAVAQLLLDLERQSFFNETAAPGAL